MGMQIAACVLLNDNSVTEMEVYTPKGENAHLNDS